MIRQTALELAASGFAGSGATIALMYASTYYAYSPGGWTVALPMLRWRSHANLLAILLVAAAVALAPKHRGVVPSVVVCLALVGIQIWRQLLWRPAAPLLQRSSLRPPPDALLAVLQDGRAVPLAEVARRRVVCLPDGTLLVWCKLARLLAAWRVPAGSTWRAGLPLATGFELVCGRQRWDATDGAAFGVADALPAVPVSVVTAATWQAMPGDRILWAKSRTLPDWTAQVRRPSWIDRGDRRAMDWGCITPGRWTPLPSDAATWSPRATGDATDRSYLARWAAMARQLGGTDQAGDPQPASLPSEGPHA